jgi:hypothetical protein
VTEGRPALQSMHTLERVDDGYLGGCMAAESSFLMLRSLIGVATTLAGRLLSRAGEVWGQLENFSISAVSKGRSNLEYVMLRTHTVVRHPELAFPILRECELQRAFKVCLGSVSCCLSLVPVVIDKEFSVPRLASVVE